MPMLHRCAIVLVLTLAPVLAVSADRKSDRPISTQATIDALPPVDDAEAARMADRVKGEFLHAWRGYRQYAWGHDDLKPLSKAPHDWYASSLLMTPVDALDTMTLMGLHDEADDA